MSHATARQRVLPRRLGPGSAGIALTPEEFDTYPEESWREGYRYELIRGVLVVTPPPGAGERSPNDVLGHLIRLHQEVHPEGSAVDDTLPEQTIFVTPNRRRADRAIWVGLGRTPNEEDDIPAIVVEFVSGRRRDALRDYQEKRAEYLAAGVREYWVIDRFRRVMTVYRPNPPGPEATIVAETQSYETPLLPGFILPLARLLAKADAWPRRGRRRPPARGAD